MHIEGNLREYIGRQLGKVPYRRQRECEFAVSDLQREDLVSRLEHLTQLVGSTLSAISKEQMAMLYPENVLGCQLSVEQFMVHLYGHLNWHLGQIDFLRRALTADGAISPVGLQISETRSSELRTVVIDPTSPP